jgi:predicted TIM-barrel fold metal-dependent hydrolase
VNDPTPESQNYYPMISADSHFLETPEMWVEWLPKKYHSIAPILVDDGVGGAAWQYADAREVEPIGLTALPGQSIPRGVTYENAQRGTYDGSARIDDQERDGVMAELIFPTPRPMSHFLNHPSRDVVLAGVEAHNRYALEGFCALAPKRLFPIAQLPTTGLADAIAVLEWAANRSFAGVALSCWPSGGDHLGKEDAPFWARVEEIGMPVCIHGSLRSRDERLLLRELVKAEAGLVGKDWVRVGGQPHQTTPRDPLEYHAGLPNPGIGIGRASSLLSVLLLSGLFAAYPTVRVALIETWVGWIPRLLESVDDVWRRNRKIVEIPLRHPPSHYWYTNMAGTFLDDSSGILLRNQIGIRNMMWSSDYPHFCTHWPNSRAVAAASMASLGAGERQRILSQNCREFFRLPDEQRRTEVPIV